MGCRSRDDDSSPTLEQPYDEREMEKIDLRDLGVHWQDDVKKQQVKGFREGKCCKQCSYVASTKLEYWEHMRCHIKGFTCPECSFVTKYKHHMNHHWLSVHDGSKPFKCKKCSYTCVSKSMLTSHLKKHSNVYPYRCANCTYKTKFCNALKKHLRKKGHQPAMVLNADGSPNPLSIIDVYGTKRGPKQVKSFDKKWDQLDHNANVTTMSNDDQRHDMSSAEPISPISPLVESSIDARYQVATAANEATNDATTGTDETAMNQNGSILTFPYSDLVAAFNLSSHLLFREDLTLRQDVQRAAINYAQRSDVLFEYTKRLNYNLGNLIVPDSFVQNLAVTCFDVTDDNADDKSDIYANANDTIEESSAEFVMPRPPFLRENHEDESTSGPLDLRKTDVIAKNQLHLELSIAGLPRAIGTNKRKGKAIKLERHPVEECVEERGENGDEPPKPFQDTEFCVPATADRPATRIEYERKIKDDVRERTVTGSADNRLICHYCEITFGDAAMYSVHMCYHGFNDPYTCNMCGHQYTDKLSFFLHIGRSKHT